ncbi:hypothetical protein JHK86_023035 [Glycine max]|nr:hypothetical protein JHK86_023035 [Glycine max]
MSWVSVCSLATSELEEESLVNLQFFSVVLCTLESSSLEMFSISDVSVMFQA